MSRLARDGTAELVSRDQILRHVVRGQGNIHFSCSADHVQDWQPYPVDPYSCYMCDHTYCTPLLALIAVQGHQTKYKIRTKDTMSLGYNSICNIIGSRIL